MELDEATKDVIIEANNLETAIKNAEATYTKLAVWENQSRTDEVKKFFATEKKKIDMSVKKMSSQLENLRLQ